MKDKDNKTTDNTENEKEQEQESKSIIQKRKEMYEKADEEERLRRENVQKRYKERKRRAAEAHDKRLEEEHIELLKLKSGLISESDVLNDDEQTEVKRTFFQKLGSFVYLNKWWLGLACILLSIAGLLIYDLASQPHPDMIVLVIGKNVQLGEESNVQEYLSQFTPDNNKNGEQLASIYYIPYTGVEKDDFVNSVPQKLSAELQNSESVIIIGNQTVDTVITIEDTLVDLSELYPDNPHVDKYKFMLKDTDFAAKIGLSPNDISDDWFLAIRKPQDLVYSKKDKMQKTYDKDFAAFDAIIKDLS